MESANLKHIKQRFEVALKNEATDFRLTKNEFSTLVDAYQQGDNKCAEIIYTASKGLIRSCIFSLGKKSFGLGAKYSDLESEAIIAFLECLKSYDIARGDAAFTTFLYTSIRNHIFSHYHYLKRHQPYNEVLSLDEPNPAYNENKKTRLDSTPHPSTAHEFDKVLDSATITPMIKKLSLADQNLIYEYFYKNQNYKAIAKQLGVSKHTVYVNKNATFKRIKGLLINGYQNLADNHSALDAQSNEYYQKIQKELKKREGLINLEKELVPYLSPNYKFVYEHRIKSFDSKSNAQLDQILHQKSKYTGNAVTNIFGKMDKIIEKKQDIKKFVERFGGKESVEDLKLFLSDKQNLILEHYVLSINPNASKVLGNFIDLSKNNLTDLKLGIEKTFEDVLQRKQNVEKFIEENGGLDFLLNDFAPLLSDDLLDIFLTTMLDYHYISAEEVCRDHGYYGSIIGEIKSMLKNFKARVAEVEDLVESMGGTDAVNNEFLPKLDALDKNIFQNRFLLYIPKLQSEICKEMGISKNTAVSHEKKLRESTIPEFIAQKQQQRE